jgi:2-phospho-L-lactate/phosphoenolpyruvate guanylyltransferase
VTQGTWIIVLIKDFDRAKQRLGARLDAAARRRLSLRTARRALRAAVPLAPTLAVCGSPAAATLATAAGAVSLAEAHSSGQNAAGVAGIAEAERLGADAVLLLSSDLPLASTAALRAMLQRDTHSGPVVVAAAAFGRAGTNALYLRPPGGITLQFGDDSLTRFREEANRARRSFVVHDDPRLALDIDEPEDLNTWMQLRGSA